MFCFRCAFVIVIFQLCFSFFLNDNKYCMTQIVFLLKCDISHVCTIYNCCIIVLMFLYSHCTLQGFHEKQIHWLSVELNETTLLKEIMSKIMNKLYIMRYFH